MLLSNVMVGGWVTLNPKISRKSGGSHKAFLCIFICSKEKKLASIFISRKNYVKEK
jgi:hypothetical protein